MILNQFKNTYLLLLLSISLGFNSCANAQQKAVKTKKAVKVNSSIHRLKTGADRVGMYMKLLRNKNVAIVANQTSVLQVLQRAEVAPNVMGSKLVSHHLVDYLHSNHSVNVQKVFAPEHGFRGKADAGEIVVDGKDSKTGLPLISLYGKNKKPSAEQLQGIDIVVFDIQDVGARFYTYISTLHYVMEACAEANIPVIVLDRPNPNGNYIDGPVLEPKHQSFVGMHPVPVVYGMTIGEYGKMINGENWLANGIKCDLTVIPLENYTHDYIYDLPIKPSPNLPNAKSINLYPSLCFFEGTTVSAGRGTNLQFQIYGSPYLNKSEFSFIPQANEGAKHPKFKGKLCYGENLSENDELQQINLSWLIKAYKETTASKTKFWNSFFTKLAGTKKLQEQIVNGVSEKTIRASWQNDLNKFKVTRAKYLLYK